MKDMDIHYETFHQTCPTIDADSKLIMENKINSIEALGIGNFSKG